MTLNTSDREIVAHRRYLVSHLRLRGFTISAILENFQKEGDFNQKTNKPWSRGTIARDLRILAKEWRESAEEVTAIHKGRELVELREARAVAWHEVDMAEVRQNIALEMKLLGTAAPTKSEISGKDGGPAIVIIAKGGIDVDKDI